MNIDLIRLTRQSLYAAQLTLLAGCSALQGSDVGMTGSINGQRSLVATADKTVIAEKVGTAPTGIFKPIPWANPGTGTAGVIESVSTDGSLGNDCRTFVTTRQTLAGADRVRGIACPIDPKHWTIDILG